MLWRSTLLATNSMICSSAWFIKLVIVTCEDGILHQLLGILQLHRNTDSHTISILTQWSQRQMSTRDVHGRKQEEGGRREWDGTSMSSL